MTVDTGDSAPDVVVDEAPEVDVTVAPTIVVDAGEPESGTEEAAEIDRAVDTGVRLARLEDGLTQLAVAVQSLSQAQESTEAHVEYVAETVADQVETVAEMGQAVDETIAEDVPVDIDGDGKTDEPPETARKHWFFR